MSSKPSCLTKKKRKAIPLVLKQKIIEQFEKGATISSLARQYKYSQPTISTIVRKKDRYNSIKVKDASTRVYNGRETIVEMERLLTYWICEKQLKGESIMGKTICEKAKEIFEDLKTNCPQSSVSNFENFQASKGWYHNFKKRNQMKSGISEGDAEPICQISNIKTESFEVTEEPLNNVKQEFSNFLEDNSYGPHQVFQVQETGLYWKKLPRKTFIAREETQLPGPKFMRDRLNLLLAANCSGDLKLKPMIIYNEDNPKIFRQEKVVRSQLGIYWKSNARSNLTKQLFLEWVTEIFCPSVEEYVAENMVEFKILLILNSAPWNDTDLVTKLEAEFDFLKIKILTPEKLLVPCQVIDDQVMVDFKKLYLKKVLELCARFTNITLRDFWRTKFNILDSINLLQEIWQEICLHFFDSNWQPVWQDFATSNSLELSETIIKLGSSLQLDINIEDLEELIQSHSELSTEDLQFLEAKRGNLGSDFEDEERNDVIPTAEIKEIIYCWDQVKRLAAKHPSNETTSLMNKKYEAAVIAYFKSLLNERQNEANKH